MSPENTSPNADQKYLQMQLQQYQDASVPSEHVVGHYAWHEAFPYETFLLHEHGDVRFPVVPLGSRHRALDFGCGPGRMVRRMSALFDQVDGVDIAPRLLDDARKIVPEGSELWATDGDNLGGAPKNVYDFIFCTVSMHHIAVWEIRMRILAAMKDALRVGGCITLQLGYTPTYPWLAVPNHAYWRDAPHATSPRRNWLERQLGHVGLQTLVEAGRIYGVVRGDPKEDGLQLMRRDHQHASWRENRYDAQGTNSVCDVAIGAKSLPLVEEDFKKVFGNFKCWFYDVSLVFGGLRGQRHPEDHWHTHWIFLHARKEGA